MLLYQLTDAGAVDEDGFGGSVAWTFRDVAKLQYLTADIWRIDPQADPLANRLETLLSVGLDHRFGEAIKLFGFYYDGRYRWNGREQRVRCNRNRAQLLTRRTAFVSVRVCCAHVPEMESKHEHLQGRISRRQPPRIPSTASFPSL